MKKKWLLLYLFTLIGSFTLTYFLYTPPATPKESFLIKNKIYLSQKIPYLQVNKTDAKDLGFKEKRSLNLDFAITPDQRQWGMMGRSSLSDDQGLGFVFPKKSFRTFWMFNCLLDLSLAYLDENKVIREIHELQAHPDKVAEGPQIKNLEELKNISSTDPIVRFFSKTGQKSSFPSKFAVEMRAGWFKEHLYKIGDVVNFDPLTKKSFIFSTLDFPSNAQSVLPSLIEFPEKDLHPIRSSLNPIDCQLVFLDDNDIVKEIISYQTFKQKKKVEGVIIPNFPFKKVLILSKKHNQIARVFIGSPLLIRPV
ncbi:hypothetical protein AB751O23_AB_00290 [Chlamydiales bacterium SCGC AB-751-O23]|jgi:uncharacterized membrane protein (UPF0127 family)|nr:hypothetical protein AB751O23_AB_00290 [Chlamydiales bacterium SCGC AB-751-O23]